MIEDAARGGCIVIYNLLVLELSTGTNTFMIYPIIYLSVDYYRHRRSFLPIYIHQTILYLQYFSLQSTIIHCICIAAQSLPYFSELHVINYLVNYGKF